jgi:hypothetical protein
VVLENDYCEKCGEKYTMPTAYKWCRPCQINHLKNDFTNWTSGNEKIDDFIQGMQLEIEEWSNNNYVVFEWIPYNQFKEIGKSDFATIYSAIWKDGPICYNRYKREHIRKSDTKVVLKCLYNLQNINEVLNQVCNVFMSLIYLI